MARTVISASNQAISRPSLPVPRAARVQRCPVFDKLGKFMTREEIETKLKETVVSALDLEDLTPADIETDVPLFGEGLGLDSIDALELGMAVKKAYGVSFSSNPADNKQIFRSVKTLADYVEAQQKA